MRPIRPAFFPVYDSRGDGYGSHASPSMLMLFTSYESTHEKRFRAICCYSKAARPVMSLPTINRLMSSVPS
jgi:hypothetical protein